MREPLEIFKALSDENRLRIIKLLEGGELCVCDIVAALGASQPKISFHLGVLRDAGLITDRRVGRWTRYRIVEGDLYRRFIVLAALERVESAEVEPDRLRLEAFLISKGTAEPEGPESPESVEVKPSLRCCG